MTGAEPQLHPPSWRLEDTALTGGARQLLPRLATGLRTAAGVAREAAPLPAALVLALQLAAGVATASGLLAATDVLSNLLAAGPTPDRVRGAAGALAVAATALAARGALTTGVAFASARLVPTVRWAAELRLVRAALAVELPAYDDPAFHDRMHRARDRGLLHLEQAAETLVELVGSAVTVLTAVLTLGVLHPVLVPLLVLAVLPDGWAVLRGARLEYASMSRIVTVHRRLAMAVDLATRREAAAEIRACQAEPVVLADYRSAAGTVRHTETRVAVAQARVQAVGRLLSGAGLGVTFLALGALLLAGWLPLAAAGTAVIAIRTAAGALTQVMSMASRMAGHALYISDYQDFLREASGRVRPATGRQPAAAPGRIALRAAGFRYPGSPPGRAALREVTLTVDRGQVVALVGENGSGKTTLAKLVAGMYRPTTGTVCWDGVDLADLDPAAVADRVVMVLQEPVRWPHTARMNVRVGRHDRPDPDGDALRAAAAAAGADTVVAGLPDGWDTLLSRHFHGGHELSGGQWQRIAVARGVYRDAPLLICDEPTAPLDPEAEYAVYESLRRLAAGRTVVLITHRLASVRHADRIFLLHRGTVAEAGTHEELLRLDGRYARLYRMQADLYGAGRPAQR